MPKNNKSVSGIMIFCVLLCGFIVLGVLAGCYYYLSSQQEQTEGTSSLSEDLSSTSSSEGTLLVARSGNATMDAYYAQALAALENMSIEEKIGQMLIARCDKEQALLQIQQYHPGGFTLYGEDFQGRTRQEVIDAIASYQNESKIPMFIATDEEGGEIVRASRYLRDTPFLSPQQLYAQGGMDAIVEDAREKSAFLQELGINLNFAPVADVSQDENDYIYSRTFGQDAKATAEYIQAVVAAMNEAKMPSVLKHFPGYGNNTDTHTGIAQDNRPLESFYASDFLPFKAGIEADCLSILVSHNIVSSMDEQYPASLSPNVHHILREDLGFKGVIMTDDLGMDAIKLYTQGQNPAVQAIIAGNDILLTSDIQGSFSAILQAVEEEKISQERINQSVLRILEMKYVYGIIK